VGTIEDNNLPRFESYKKATGTITGVGNGDRTSKTCSYTFEVNVDRGQ
jgi:hypothetical protein